MPDRMVLMDKQKAQELLAFAEDARTQLKGLEASAVLKGLEQQHEDMKSAMGSFIERGQPDQALRLATSLVPFWMARKRIDEGISWLTRALAMVGGDDVHRGHALFSKGYLAFWKGDDELSSLLQRQAVNLGRHIKDPTIIALALVGLARLAIRSDIPEAQRLCREAMEATEGTADRDGRSSAMHVLAVAAQMAGNFGEARDLMRGRIKLARETGNFATVAIESNNLSMVERQLGNNDEAEVLALEALDISSRRGDGLAIAWNLNGLAAAVANRGVFERAAKLIGAADTAMKSAGGAWPPDELVHYDRTVSSLTEALGDAEFARCREAGRSMTSADAIDFALGKSNAPQLPPA
ncbi:MAG: tetratricopeptide repeat protein [Anaerolineales bacterium]